MSKSTLTEIDRLEGIAQAYGRARPIVPMTGVLEDCNLARDMVAQIVDLQADLECYNERIAEIQEDRNEAGRDLKGAKIDLDTLMASLSARLER